MLRVREGQMVQADQTLDPFRFSNDRTLEGDLPKYVGWLIHTYVKDEWVVVALRCGWTGAYVEFERSGFYQAYSITTIEYTHCDPRHQIDLDDEATFLPADPVGDGD